ncbi:MAG: OadG family protein [Verrucomicrobia bacterium]|jgi:Na+-transporting methylmalonyl-CoA/oxaloacetate decarboxylase gamma subunit|nr:OadG family protein [Verrucomicrobiota bacterium]MBT7065054.1 OadG family protein [Verrucomicrobiota bacterium]MBT7699581.1 OadG family protein [Verrucomicrobiota bacterium]
MNSVSVGWERVLNSEPNGLAVSAVGMCIVFVSLVLISAFIAALPHLLTLVAKVFPDSDTKAATDHDRVAVAIAAALYREKYGSPE